MKNNKYDSHIGKPVVHSTAKGGSYVKPFDIIRSTNGRAVIKSHASMSTNVKTISDKRIVSSPDPTTRRSSSED